MDKGTAKRIDQARQLLDAFMYGTDPKWGQVEKAAEILEDIVRELGE